MTPQVFSDPIDQKKIEFEFVEKFRKHFAYRYDNQYDDFVGINYHTLFGVVARILFKENQTEALNNQNLAYLEDALDVAAHAIEEAVQTLNLEAIVLKGLDRTRCDKCGKVIVSGYRITPCSAYVHLEEYDEHIDHCEESPCRKVHHQEERKNRWEDEWLDQYMEDRIGGTGLED